MKFIYVCVFVFVSKLVMAADPSTGTAAATSAVGDFMLDVEAGEYSSEDSQSMLGLESINSTGSLLGGATNISATYKISREIICREGKGLFQSGLSIKITACNKIVNDLYQIGFEYCQSQSGTACKPENISLITATANAQANFAQGHFKLTGCGSNKCILEVKNTPSDSFDSGSMREESESRELEGASLGTSMIESTTAMSEFQEAQMEASASADYLAAAMEQIETDGEMPIYRNSPSDIERYGQRDAVFGVDMGDASTPPSCTTMGLNTNSETCQSNYGHVEYVCEPSEVICTFERNETVVTDCGRKRTAQCVTRIPCDSSNMENRKAIPRASSSDMTLLYNDASYPLMNFKTTAGMKGWSTSNSLYNRTISFNLDSPNDVQTLILQKLYYDDWVRLSINGQSVFFGPRNPMDTLFIGRVIGGNYYCVGYLQNGDGTAKCEGHEKGRTDWTGSLDLKPYLRSGYNYIQFSLAVGGLGGMDADFEFRQNCDCVWGDSWEDKACAISQ